MNKKSLYLFYSFLALFSILLVEFAYLGLSVDENAKKSKQIFVSVVGLPDLALMSESYETRHRSLSNVFDIYSTDASLREYTISSYAVSHSNIQNKKSSNE